MKFELHYVEKYIILSVIICVLIISSGYSFAYFTSNGGGVIGEGAKMTTTTATVPKVEFDGGISTLNLTNIVPDNNKIWEKNFSVSFTPTTSVSEIDYYIHLDFTTNTFETCSDGDDGNRNDKNNCTISAQELVYSLYEDGKQEPIIAETDITDGKNASNKSKVVKVTHKSSEVGEESVKNYTLRVQFKDTGKDQNHNAGKSLEAKIDVTFSDTSKAG